MELLENMLLSEGINYFTAMKKTRGGELVGNRIVGKEIVYGLIYANNEYGDDFKITCEPSPYRRKGKYFKVSVNGRYTIGWVDRDRVIKIIKEQNKEVEY